MITELWSCGQTGVAQGALRAAKHCGIRTRGWIAQGCLTEDGPAPELVDMFGLEELTRPGELQPVRCNVKDSDSTVWIAPPPRIAPDKAYWMTRKSVATYGHPFLLIPSKAAVVDGGRQIALWAERWDATRLHVMGPRASVWPEGEERARLIIVEALHALGVCRARPRKLALVG